MHPCVPFLVWKKSLPIFPHSPLSICYVSFLSIFLLFMWSSLQLFFYFIAHFFPEKQCFLKICCANDLWDRWFCMVRTYPPPCILGVSKSKEPSTCNAMFVLAGIHHSCLNSFIRQGRHSEQVKKFNRCNKGYPNPEPDK